jgi:hypothetical protein
MTLHHQNHALTFSDEVFLMRKLASGTDGNGGKSMMKDESWRENLVAFAPPSRGDDPREIAEACGGEGGGSGA